MSAIQGVIGKISGKTGYKCVNGKGHLDNCKDLHGVCETNSICKFIDDIKRRGKLDKNIVTYSEANNLENGNNNFNSLELVFDLNYDEKDGNRVTLRLISPVTYELDVDRFKHNKILKMLEDIIFKYIKKNKNTNLKLPFDNYVEMKNLEHIYNKNLKNIKKELQDNLQSLFHNDIHSYIKYILQYSKKIPNYNTLIIPNINNNNYINIRNYINNIKKKLKHDYKSYNRHIIPILPSNFIGSEQVDKYKYPIKNSEGGSTRRSRRGSRRGFKSKRNIGNFTRRLG